LLLELELRHAIAFRNRDKTDIRLDRHEESDRRFAQSPVRDAGGVEGKDEPMDLDRAKTVAEVAKVLVDLAKVEMAFLKVTGAMRSTGFLPDGDDAVLPATRRLTNGTGKLAVAQG
jgi:hypothetical protein